ncbi:MAG: DUF2851 family protein [Bacteroidia bacterium]
MSEDFLHYLWKFKLFNSELLTTNGESIQILKSGEHNKNSGPDFFNAKIKIGNTTWAGNVEIHLKASDWNHHGHQKDKAYQNIILHAVHDADAKNTDMNRNEIPTVQLKNKFNAGLWNQYENLLKSSQWIPCSNMIETVDKFTINAWIERMVIERLEQKIIVVENLLKQNQNNWEETFYQSLARNFGFKLNASPFELLAKSLPSKCLAKHKNNLLQIEAMLFGQAGLLEEKLNDKYPNELKREYIFLQSKFSLQPIEKHLWKFAKTRPVNFPSLRIAQFAGLVFKSSHLLSMILETKKAKDILKLFDVSASEYWSTHFRFDHESKSSEKNLGKSSAENILINTVIPFLFLYGKEKNDDYIKSRSLELLEQLPAENNSIISQWQFLKIEAGSAYRSQGLIQLKNEYCSQKKCLNCGIGNKILNKTSQS